MTRKSRKVRKPKDKCQGVSMHNDQYGKHIYTNRNHTISQAKKLHKWLGQAIAYLEQMKEKK